jgi:hypothetical protein
MVFCGLKRFTGQRKWSSFCSNVQLRGRNERHQRRLASDLRRDQTVTEWLDRGAVGNGVVGNGLLVTERTDHGAARHGAEGPRATGGGWLDRRLLLAGWLKRAAGYGAD